MPSTSEGFGLVFLESLACGVPVILPKDLPIVGVKDLLHETNCVLLEDNSVEAIKKVIDNILVYKFDKYHISNSVKNFQWKEKAEEYLEKIINYC